MDRSIKRKVVAGTVAGFAIAGGGGAIAATKLISPAADSQAVVNDAAKQLGVQPSALSKALKQALENRVDAAVAAGDLTKEQGAELKTRIESGELPLFGLGRPEGHGGFMALADAASYLGLTEAQLRTELEAGKSLAQVATAHGKTADGLVQALVAGEKKRLDAAVSAGTLTRAQADSMLADAKQRLTDLVNRAPGEGRPFDGPRFDGRNFGGGPGAPPPEAAPPAA